MFVGLRIGVSLGDESGKEKLVINHCPAGGADSAENKIANLELENNFWAGPPSDTKEQPSGSTQTSWSSLRQVSPALADAGEDCAEFSSDCYKCKKLRRTHEYVNHERATLLSFGASAQT